MATPIEAVPHMTKASKAPACGYSADTEILTRHQGWVTFDRLTYLDEVATRSAEGRFEWQFARRVHWTSYQGEMVRFHGRVMDLHVTPNQRVLWSPDSRTPERGSPASAILERMAGRTRQRQGAFFFPTSIWDAPELAEKVFPGVRRTKMGPKPRDTRMTGDQFAAFMGMYIAEGSSTPRPHDWLVAIAQSVGGKGYQEYKALLTEIVGHEPGRTPSAWVLHSRPLYEYLRPLGKAIDKWLPDEVLNLSRRQLRIFWEYYFLGDGNYERHANGTDDGTAAGTASPVLAGQLQEVIQKLGWVSSVRKYQYKPNALVPRSGPIYKLRIRKAANPSCGLAGLAYTGMVGNAAVPNGVIYVRRDGKPAWCGAAA